MRFWRPTHNPYMMLFALLGLSDLANRCPRSSLSDAYKKAPGRVTAVSAQTVRQQPHPVCGDWGLPAHIKKVPIENNVKKSASTPRLPVKQTTYLSRHGFAFLHQTSLPAPQPDSALLTARQLGPVAQREAESQPPNGSSAVTPSQGKTPGRRGMVGSGTEAVTRYPRSRPCSFHE